MGKRSQRVWANVLSAPVWLVTSVSLVACGGVPRDERLGSDGQAVPGNTVEASEQALGLAGPSSVTLTGPEASASGSIGFVEATPDETVSNDHVSTRGVEGEDVRDDDVLVIGDPGGVNPGPLVPNDAGEPTLVVGNAGADDGAGHGGALGSQDPRVQVLSANGSGCAGQTAIVTSVADDLSAFTLRFGGYTLETSAERPFARENCVFMIDVDPPAGMTYAVTALPLSGRADLQSGATGRAGTTYSYQGESETAVVTEDVPSGASEWRTPGELAPDQVLAAPCDAERLLILNTSVVLDARNGGAASTISVNPDLRVELVLAACE